MCVAIPMRVRSVDGFEACCERSAAAAGDLCGPCTPAFDWNVSAQEGVSSCVNVTLAMLDEPGAVHPGDWLLVFRDEAIRRVTEEEAREVAAALEATAAVMAGDLSDENIRAGFADLVDREPPLPEHLKKLVDAQAADREKPAEP